MAEGSYVAFSGGSVWDPASSGFIQDGVVLVQGEDIVDVGTINSVSLPDDASVVHLQGTDWVLPGLINLHAHFSLDGGVSPVESLESEPILLTAMRAVSHAREALRSGVTTVRELGSREGLSLLLREAIDRRYVDGPRILSSGAAITITGGHALHIGREADGPVEVMRAVREEAKRGADLIKVIASGGNSRASKTYMSPGLTFPEIEAAVAEAGRHHLRVAAHAHTASAIHDAVRAGVDTIEHGTYLDAETARMMAGNGTALVSTLAVHHKLNAGGTIDPRIENHRRKVEGQAQSRVASLQLAKAAGVRIGAGSDAGTILNSHAEFLVELEELVSAGLEPSDAIRAATSWAAEILGNPNLGKVTKGGKADLLVVSGDPRGDLAAVRSPRCVVTRGAPFWLNNKTD